jgi:hypothetical protein
MIAPAIDEERPPIEPSSSSNSISVVPSVSNTRSWLWVDPLAEKLVMVAA